MSVPKATFLVLVSLIIFSLPTPAQWSHKDGDPNPYGSSHTVQPFTKAEWEASHFASGKDLQWFRDAKYGMFIHFGLSTHNNAELSWGTCYTRKLPDGGHGPVPDEVWQSWSKDFRFEKFNARELVATAQAAGFRYLVAIAKHHEGFHLWDTAFSDFKVTKTPFGRDYLKELADACHEAKLPFGIYYSQRDWYHPDYAPVDPSKATKVSGLVWKPRTGEVTTFGERHKKYIDYQFNVCRELCTKYGKVDIFWWDAAWWGGMFTAEMWDAEKLTRMVRELQPGILQNNRCSVPGDFDTPEQRLGVFQDWRPWESCICLTRTWSYSGTPPKPLATLLRMIVNNACCDGNILLSWGPHWDGEFDASETTRLLEIGQWLKLNGAGIYATRGGPWKIADWGGSTRRGNTAWLHIWQWKNETLRLPSIPNRKVQSARRLNGAAVECKQNLDSLTINVPKAQQDPVDTIIELTFDQSLDGLLALDSKPASLFSDKVTFGQVLSRQAAVRTSSMTSKYPSPDPRMLVAEKPAEDYAFLTDRELNPWVEIDLGRQVYVTGVRVLNRPRYGQHADTLRLSVSIDGKDWADVWQAERAESSWEIPVTDMRAGAEVPGRLARYVRLAIKPAEPQHFHLRQVEIYGKDLE